MNGFPGRRQHHGVHPRQGISRLVVNGTSPLDWSRVSDLAKIYPEKVVPCFGLHPWKVNDVAGNWDEILEGFLETDPSSGQSVRSVSTDGSRATISQSKRSVSRFSCVLRNGGNDRYRSTASRLGEVFLRSSLIIAQREDFSFIPLVDLWKWLGT